MMTQITKRALSACLACLMLTGTLASCAETSDNENGALTEATTTPATENGADTVVTETELADIEDALPDDLRFDGDEIVIVSNYREGWTSGEITAEKITGDAVNDAVYERNKKVEERLGVTFVNIEETEPNAMLYVTAVADTVRAGTHEYDIMAGACYASLNESLNGTFRNLRALEYVDFDMPWWSRGFNEVVEYQGSQFAMTGSMLLSMYRFAFVTVFNKELFDDHKVPYLYEDVKNGTWTLDRQIELVPIFHVDGGIQGTQDEDGDVYGLVTNDYISVDPYWSSCMVNILQKNEEGVYEIVFDSGKLHSVAEKLIKLYYESGNAVYDYKYEENDGEQAHIRDMFSRDGAAMATLRLLELESASIRNMESEYGVIPMPKFDTVQTEYRTLLHDWFTVICVPSTIEEARFDEIGAVLEAMGSDSYKNLRPAYYETTLRTKIAQDPESAEMLDGIISNIYIDAGIIYTYALSTFHDNFRKIMGSGTNSVTSDYKGIVARLERRVLPKMLEKLEALADES